jgi:hypothetical protein
MSKRKHFSLFALFVVNGGICSSISVGQDPVDFSKQFKDSVTRFRDSKPKVDGNPSITERVRKTTWRLMTGELAAIKSNGLSSTSFDALTTGLDELDTILHAANNKTSLNVWNFNVIMDSSFSLCTV